MAKSKCQVLSEISDGYRAIKEKVEYYWKKFGNDVSKWPSPSQLFEEIEDIMAPYGDSRAHRLSKVRNLYNKLTKQIFIDHGEHAPDLKKRREIKKSTSAALDATFDDRIYFGAAFNKQKPSKISRNIDDEEDDDDDDDDDDTTNSKLSTNALLTEEAFTTLAATCLGDDLNALEASTIFKPLIKKAKENFSNVTSMQQKILYLETLFAAVEKEQERLLQKVKKDGHGMDSFFKNVVECESNIRTGYSHLQDAKYNMSFKHYNHAMNLILAYSEYTSLLDPLMLEIRTRRAHAAFEAAKYEECVQDACILLQGKDVRSEETRANLLKVKGKALIKMGCHDEGRETLAKWKILCPQGDDDEEIETLHQNVNIS